MEKFSELRPLKRAAIIILGYVLLTYLFHSFQCLEAFKYGGRIIFNFLNLLLLSGCCVSIIYGIFDEEKNSHIFYGFAIISLLSIITFISNIADGVFNVYYYSYYSGNSNEEFYFPGFLVGLLYVVAYIGFCAFSYVNSNKKFDALSAVNEKLSEFFEKLWFLPAALMAAVPVLSLLFWFVEDDWSAAFRYFSFDSLCWIAITILLTLIWKFKDGIKAKENQVQINSGDKLSANAYCGIVKVLLLSVFTFGIWPLIWVYKITKELNCADGYEYRDPCKKLLLFMFIPFYSMYWFYQSAIRVDSIAKEEELISDIAMISLAFSMIFPLGSILMIQGKINEIILKYNK